MCSSQIKPKEKYDRSWRKTETGDDGVTRVITGVTAVTGVTLVTWVLRVGGDRRDRDDKGAGDDGDNEDDGGNRGWVRGISGLKG